uniref:Transcriptional repressor Tup1 N-terminal domain-containing protein n=1 Tax=Arcella intermedia TaxID=1963864 RepID=A0A6B2L0Y8_9EUKA
MEGLKAEYEGITRELNLCKLQRDEYERKLQQQLQEIQGIQQNLFDLERNYSKMKAKYEEEIRNLRGQLQSGEAPSRPASGPESAELNNIIKRHRELPTPPSTPSAYSLPQSLSLSQIAKQTTTTPKSLMKPPGAAYSFPSGGNNGTSTPSTPNTTPNPNPVNTPGTPTNKPKRKSKSPEHEHDKTPVSNPPKEPSANGNTNTTPAAPAPSTGTPANGTNPAASVTATDDWAVGYNPNIPKNMDVQLEFDVDHSSVVCCVSFSRDGKYLATGCNLSAQIFDVSTGNKIHVFREKQNSEMYSDLYIRSVSFSPDGKFLATGAEDKSVKIWDIEKEQIKHNFTGHTLDIYSLDFSPDGKFIVSGSGDKKIKIWRIEDGSFITTIGDDNGPVDGVTSVAFSPDGTQIVAGSLDRIVRVWDMESGFLTSTFEGHMDAVYSVAFSPDGKTLASGSLDKTVKLWDLGRQHKSRCKDTLQGHKDFVLSVAFSVDGNWLVSGSKDRSVQFWDPRASVTHMILQGHRNSVISVATAWDAERSIRRFATGSGDCRSRIWRY